MKKKLVTMALLVMTSCTKDMELIYSVKEHRLVLDCVFNNKSPVSAYVSTNQFILDTSEVRVENAIVLLYENEQFVDTLLHKGRGFYESLYYPKPQMTYQVKVFAEGFEQISAKDTMPDDNLGVQIISFKKNVTVVENINRDLLSLKIIDSNPKLEYYELELTNVGSLFDENHVEYIDLFHVSNPAISIKSWEPPGVRTLLFNDKTFNNSEIIMDIFIHSNEKTPPTVKLRKVSYQYYNFKNMLYIHHDNQLLNRETIDEMFKGDPVEMFSNVENGYGIFAGYVEVVIR